MVMSDTPFHALQHECIAVIASPPQVLAMIEGVVVQFLRNLMAPNPTIRELTLVSRDYRNSCLRQAFFGNDDTLYLSHATHDRSFMTRGRAKAFIRVWKVLELCYQLLRQRKKATQRELFYRLLSDAPEYFQCQQQVNRAIQDVVALLKCSRHSLGIMASSRGAVVGRLLVQEPNGELIDCTKLGSSGQTISGDLHQLQRWKFSSDARYILLVEKDAIFQRLAEDRFFQSVPCVILTAKGYPDLASRWYSLVSKSSLIVFHFWLGSLLQEWLHLPLKGKWTAY